MSLSKKAILFNLIDHIQVDKIKKSNFIFVIAFIGLTGVGKSTIAHLLKEKSKLQLFSHDQIRQYLDSIGENKNDRKLIEWLSLERAKYLIREKIPFILDGDIINYYSKLEKILKNNNGNLLLINVICDLNEVIKRLEKRANGEKQIFGNINYSEANFNTYLERRIIHSQGNYPKNFFLTINNTHNSEEQVDELWFKIKIWAKEKDINL